MWMYLPLLLFLPDLSGTIVDEKSRPIEGAAVVVISANLRDAPKMATTDSMGRFEISPAPPGPFRVEAYAPGYAPFRKADIDWETPLAIVLERGGETITGVVRDGATLDPLEGAIVETRVGEAGARVSAAPRLGLVESVSDERGAFRLEGLAKGSYLVSASAPG